MHFIQADNENDILLISVKVRFISRCHVYCDQCNRAAVRYWDEVVFAYVKIKLVSE